MAGDVEKLEDTLTNLRIDIAQQFAEVKTLLTAVANVNTDHENRIRKLERAIWIAGGVSLAGGGVLGSVLSSVTGS